MDWKILQSIGRKALTKTGLLETYVHLRNAGRQLLLEIKIDLRHRAACKKIQDILRSVKPLNLRLGSEKQHKNGWINVALFNSSSDFGFETNFTIP